VGWNNLLDHLCRGHVGWNNLLDHLCRGYSIILITRLTKNYLGVSAHLCPTFVCGYSAHQYCAKNNFPLYIQNMWLTSWEKAGQQTTTTRRTLWRRPIKSNTQFSYLQIIVLPLLFCFQIKPSQSSKILLANSLINSGTSSDSLSIIMRSVGPPISFSFHIT